MRFALDESGTFPTTSNEPIPPVSVAVTLVVPDDEWSSLIGSYRSFRSTLAPDEIKNDEPKGGLLRHPSKLAYCDLLARHPRVLVCPCIVDLGHFPNECAKKLRDGLAQEVEALAGCAPNDQRNSLAAVSVKIAELSAPQAVRLYAWARAFFHALHYAIQLPDAGDTLTEWDHREFFIDPAQGKPGSDEEFILSEMLSLWMMEWSRAFDGRRWWNFAVPDETVYPRHSFRDRFFRDDGISLAALLTRRVRFDRSSKNEELLQLVDIAAFIVGSAARERQADPDALAVYERLMANCPYEPDFGIGLITPHQELAGGGIPNRFSALVAAMQRSYQTYRATTLQLPN